MTTKGLLILACVFAMSAGGVGAQAASATNCPEATAKDNTGAKGSGGMEKAEAQPVEKSAILPNIGGHQESAAPTIKQDGKEVAAQTDCPKGPNRIDAPKAN